MKAPVITVTIKGGPQAGKTKLLMLLKGAVDSHPEVMQEVGPVVFEELTTRKGLTRV